MNFRKLTLSAIIPLAIISVSTPALAKGFEHGQQHQQMQQYAPSKYKQQQRGDRRSNSRYIRVHRGDTLSRIAYRYRTTVYRLKRLNHLRGDTIYVGQRLRVR